MSDAICWSNCLQEKLSPKGIWLRTEKGIREAEGLEQADGLVAGEEPPRPLFVDRELRTVRSRRRHRTKDGVLLRSARQSGRRREILRRPTGT